MRLGGGSAEHVNALDAMQQDNVPGAEVMQVQPENVYRLRDDRMKIGILRHIS